MNHLVTFADDRMNISACKLLESAYKFGVHIARCYQPKDLPQTFIEMVDESTKKEKGYWLYSWKPFVVWDYLQKMPEDDLLIYADAGQTIVSNVQAVINRMDEDIMMFSNGWNHLDWCKMGVASAINGVGILVEVQTDCGVFKSTEVPDEWRTKKQTQASLIFFRNTAKVRAFVKEWMLYLLMPGFGDDSPSKLPNVPTFQETRWDQSVLCCLQIRDGYKLHWFPTLTAYHIKSEFPQDTYPAIVDHHRKRNDQW